MVLTKKEIGALVLAAVLTVIVLSCLCATRTAPVATTSTTAAPVITTDR
jgi:hypothetical protein